MYFLDRFALGGNLADSLADLKGKEAIVICLKEGALLTCVEIAARLNAWIYPLIYEKVADPDDARSYIGAITAEGEFCVNPGTGQSRIDYLQTEFMTVFENSKREAFSKVNGAVRDYGFIPDKHVMNGRDVVLVGDILTSTIELAAVSMLLKPLTPRKIHGVAGNVTIEVSDMFHLASDKISLLDILPAQIFDDDHYFEKPDPYSVPQKRQLAQNIKKFWK